MACKRGVVEERFRLVDPILKVSTHLVKKKNEVKHPVFLFALPFFCFF